MATHRDLNRRPHPARSTRPLPPSLGGASRAARLADPVVSLKAARFEVTATQRLRTLVFAAWQRLQPIVAPRKKASRGNPSFIADYWTPDTSWNEHARRVLDLVNTARTRNGLAPVKQHFDLWYMAADRSNDMAYHQYFSHTDRAGRGPERRFREEGIRFNVAGENIAYGQANADEVMQDWMNSPGHRANILDRYFHDTAVGVSPHPPSALAHGQAGAIYTQDFGSIIGG